MASIAYNVAQITNFDIQDLPTIEKENGKYAKYEFEAKIEKLGYCCEPKGIGSWIYLYLKTQEEETQEKVVPIQIGKSGMYEVQAETFSKLNDKGITEQINMKLKIIAIELPKNLKFTLDYAYNMT